jgi:hypothetical protein
MLPVLLSGNLCSLRGGEERLVNGNFLKILLNIDFLVLHFLFDGK